MNFRKMQKSFIFLVIVFVIGCDNLPSNDEANKDLETPTFYADTSVPVISNNSQPVGKMAKMEDYRSLPTITSLTPSELVGFAKTLIGVTYKYASTDPTMGFDCSGFITYVFNHFNISVPRSSVDFTNVGKDVSLKDAREGDLILFTGTVDSISTVGHMGIVTQNTDTLQFIHSTSGRAYGVIISNFTDHYKKRFVKVVRIFAD